MYTLDAIESSFAPSQVKYSAALPVRRRDPARNPGHCDEAASAVIARRDSDEAIQSLSAELLR